MLQVTLAKDHTKWNFDALLELIEGPLLNHKRMEEAIKVSRFTRKIMSFFLPFNHRFSDLPRIKVCRSAFVRLPNNLNALSQANDRWVRLGCSFLTTLMASPDGLRFLAEDEFLKQIVKSFTQLDPVIASLLYHTFMIDMTVPSSTALKIQIPSFQRRGCLRR